MAQKIIQTTDDGHDHDDGGSSGLILGLVLAGIVILIFFLFRGSFRGIQNNNDVTQATPVPTATQTQNGAEVTPGSTDINVQVPDVNVVITGGANPTSTVVTPTPNPSTTPSY